LKERDKREIGRERNGGHVEVALHEELFSFHPQRMMDMIGIDDNGERERERERGVI
jgi:hypothetical protein